VQAVEVPHGTFQPHPKPLTLFRVGAFSHSLPPPRANPPLYRFATPRTVPHLRAVFSIPLWSAYPQRSAPQQAATLFATTARDDVPSIRVHGRSATKRLALEDASFKRCASASSMRTRYASRVLSRAESGKQPSAITSSPYIAADRTSNQTRKRSAPTATPQRLSRTGGGKHKSGSKAAETYVVVEFSRRHFRYSANG
jgi:hypothetical protein